MTSTTEAQLPPLSEITRPVLTIDEAANYLSLGRSSAYQMAKAGSFPCEVLRVGRKYKVLTSSLQKVLGVPAA